MNVAFVSRRIDYVVVTLGEMVEVAEQWVARQWRGAVRLADAVANSPLGIAATDEVIRVMRSPGICFLLLWNLILSCAVAWLFGYVGAGEAGWIAPFEAVPPQGIGE